MADDAAQGWNCELIYKQTPQGPLRLYGRRIKGMVDLRPAIVFFHGGGWSSGTPDQFLPYALQLADREVMAFSAEYRLEQRHHTRPQDALADARSAMRYIRRHAAELGVDVSRIGAGGGSAGGHLAAACALIDGFDDPADDLTLSPVPAALILFNPVLDTTPTGFGAARIGPRDAKAMSLLHAMAPNAPPCLIQHGSADATVPIAIVEAFAARMRDADNLIDLRIYPNREHGFFNPRPGNDLDFHATADVMLDFLARLGWL